MNEKPKSETIGVQDLIVLSEEIASIARIGMPLEPHLNALAKDRSAMGRLAGRLGQHMSAGMTLGDALDAESASVPPLFRAIVKAGLRAGRLSAALESLTLHSRQVMELRRTIELSLVYPLLVTCFGYALFLVFLDEFVIRYQEFYAAAFETPTRLVAVLSWLRSNMSTWAPIPPLLLLVSVIWWFVSERKRPLPSGQFPVPLRWLPGMRSAAHYFRSAALSETAAMLLEHRTPLPEAILLAGETISEPRWRMATAALSERVSKGELASVLPESHAPLPPMLVWALCGGGSTDTAAALGSLARSYRHWSMLRVRAVGIFFPVVALIVIGGAACLVYTLALYGPLIELFERIAI
jgi:general secretion pathway protein F